MVNTQVLNNTSDNTLVKTNPGDAPGWGRCVPEQMPEQMIIPCRCICVIEHGMP